MVSILYSLALQVILTCTRGKTNQNKSCNPLQSATQQTCQNDHRYHLVTYFHIIFHIPKFEGQRSVLKSEKIE